MLKKIKGDLIYYYMLFLVVVLPIIPKDFSTIAGIIPVRVMLIGVLLLIYLYDKFILKKEMKRSPKIFIIIYSLFLFFMVFGFIKAVDKLLFFYTYAKFIVLGVLIYVVSKYKFDKKKVNSFYEGLFASSAIVSIVGIVQYILDINLNYNGIYKYIGSAGRAISTFFNPIYLGIFLFFVIILLLYKIGITKEKKPLIRYFLFMFINIIALLLTYTRTVAVLLAITVVVYLVVELFNKNKLKHNILKYFIVFMFLVINIYAIPGVKYLYSSTVVSFLPYKVSYKLLTFTNNYMMTNFDLSVYGFDKLKLELEAEKEEQNKEQDKVDETPKEENPSNKPEENKPSENKPTDDKPTEDKPSDDKPQKEEVTPAPEEPKEEEPKEEFSEEDISDASVNTRKAFKARFSLSRSSNGGKL